MWCLPQWVKVVCLPIAGLAATVPSRPSLVDRRSLSLLSETRVTLASLRWLLPSTCLVKPPAEKQLSSLAGRRRCMKASPQTFRGLTQASTLRPAPLGLSYVVITVMSYRPKKWPRTLRA